MKRNTSHALVVVAVPVLRVSARVVLEKGRGWSAVDELVLWALARLPRSAAALSEEIDLPRQVVLEVIFRMMRFRLVEVALSDGVPVFRATIYGSGIVLGGEEIPTLKKRLSRKVAFVVDRITGTVFAKRDVRVENEGGLQSFREVGADVRDIRVNGVALKTTPAANVVRFQRVLNADETLIYFDGDTLIERDDEYIIVTADGGDLRGLPPLAPNELTDQIQRIVREKAPARPINISSVLTEKSEQLLPILVRSQFDAEKDLIAGGQAHEKALLDTLKCVRKRLIIHSTFLKKDRFEVLIPQLREASRRGARIDILWGAGSPDEPGEHALPEAIAISKIIAGDDVLKRRVKIHLQSTGSHAKIILADDGNDGWIGIIGSCNWLYSKFDRFELSARVRGSHAAAEVMDVLGRLVSPSVFRPEIGSELHLLSQELRHNPVQSGSSTFGIVIGPMHEALIREASGRGTDRFLVASDRLGNSAFANAIVPAEVFAERTGIMPTVVFGQPSGAIANPGGVPEILREADRRGVKLVKILAGFHAKFLLWGNDEIVITSLNWGSASVKPDHPEYEIGIYINSLNISRILYKELGKIWPDIVQ